MVVSIPEPHSLSALHMDGIGAALDGPGEHGVIAIVLDDLLRSGIHEVEAFLDYEQ